jgi:hypothetical protein
MLRGRAALVRALDARFIGLDGFGCRLHRLSPPRRRPGMSAAAAFAGMQPSGQSVGNGSTFSRLNLPALSRSEPCAVLPVEQFGAAQPSS